MTLSKGARTFLEYRIQPMHDFLRALSATAGRRNPARRRHRRALLETAEPSAMTTIHEFAVSEGQEWVLPVDDGDFEFFFGLDGRSLDGWEPPVMRRVAEGEPVYSDFPWLGGHAPLLRQPAVDALAAALRPYGEFVALRGEKVWLFNVTNVIDALDEARSQIVRFDGGDILAIERYAFDAGRIGSAEVFKLPMRASPVFVNDVFVERVRQAGLRNVSFKPVWTSGTAID
ncbi:hypothetical protein RFM98_18065 [Mesorhizobium sp. VK9D]|uniref:imm11 family protein n=1 Tax=Mesorhizobium australafricanum TaxID=3072311 RepID=UPI002A241099|nr:DUF1629 domain-containing protein [Mesorhizobium sp. VK9D]MDX8454671.1 hypothetical protein [Mesorhizobium sp. VK9D]